MFARTGAANPLNNQVAAAGGSSPSLGDLDGDGDLDVVTGERYGTHLYFENTGSAASPAFLARTGFSNPFVFQDVGDGSTPVLVDLDADGDLDLVSDVKYFENTGNATGPAFTLRTGAADPMNPSVRGFADHSRAAFGDLDGDGDLDLVAGRLDGQLIYFENLGSRTSPAFFTTGVPLGEGLGVEGPGRPALGDLDGDGDLDLVSGNDGLYNYAFFAYFENTGSATSPAFVMRTLPINPFYDLGTRDNSPALGDLDGDGDVDLVSGELAGGLLYFQSFVVQQSSLRATALTGGANPLAGQDVGSLSGPALADLDGDGDGDLVVGENAGTFRYFANTGSATHPLFIARTGAANPLNGRDVGDAAKPALADLDGDGDFDLMAGRLSGDFDYFANTGNAVNPVFSAPVANPFGLTIVASDSSAPILGDVDGDGDLDLVAGQYEAFAYFENTGSRASPAFVERTGAANLFDGVDPGSYASPALADFDGDGDLDLVSGGVGGQVRYFENVGSARSPAFVRHTGAANPLHGSDVGQYSAPAAIDLDGDGDSDLVTGSLAGTFAVHYFPEPARGLLLGAGIALLRVFDRLRRRSSR
jgi:hypothetical protein